MKKIQFILLIISFFFSFQNSGLNSSLNKSIKNPKIKCGVDKIKSNPEVYKLTEEQKRTIDKKRKLVDEFETIRIYLSNNWINTQISMEREDRDLLNKVFGYLNNVIEYIKKIIKVKPLQYNIKCSYAEQKEWDLCLSNDNSDKVLAAGVSYDLVIFPVFTSRDETSCFNLKRDEFTNRPIVSILNIPYNLVKKSGNNAKFYIESLLLHEFTHILGFLNETFQYFPNGYDGTIQKRTTRGIERYFIVTEKVVNFAQEYYGCPSISGLELEDQDENGLPSSHWEARILLGEYMNLDQYQPEVVISDFTLALLEDSGWYQVKYYTGGLMRFGKNKGCNFLSEECSSSQGITTFKNEFFDIEDDNNPSCSSGRLSRAYCQTNDYATGIPIIEYSRITIADKSDLGGKTKNADYCFGFIQDSNEEINNLYVGNCKFGNGNYGSKITYNQSGKHSNSESENELGEKYSDISFCILSEAFPTQTNLRNRYNGVIHPMCYEMICSEKILTVKIKNQYIVCPREGGKVEVNGDFEGYIYCPDYNLICTGTVQCNDMFDCIDKKSETKKPNYEDYTVNGDTSSQKISDLKNLHPILAYELENNGTCPINCAQCKENKKCYKCRENYNLIGEKENDNKPIICDNQIDLSVGYFEKNNVFYPCIEFCNVCSNGNTCTTCDNFHKLNNRNTECIDKIENCETYNNINFECTKCKTGYAFLKEDRENCYNNFNEENYFTLDHGISYYPCDTNISNCDVCNNLSDRCSKCKENFYFLGNNRTFCYDKIDLSKYYSDNGGISYILCNSTIDHCDTCTYNNNLKCDFCQKNYYFIEENRDNCHNNLDLSKYYSEDNGKSYYPCNKEFANCEICNNNKNKCEKCFEGFYFIGLNKEKCETAADLDKYYTEDNGITYMPCDTYMDGCETCTNRSYCTSCKPDYYFVEKQKNKCYYKINIESFYKEGDAYFPCNKSIDFCNKCRVKDACTECNPNYYFIGDDRTFCDTGKNLKKYYTNDFGISYFPCDTNMENCDECYNENFCYLCKNLYFLKYENSRQCFLEEDLKAEKTYYRYNVTHYRKCSENILNCNICSSSQECDQCISNYYFVNDDHTQCINIMDINIEEYFEYDKYNYHICSWLVDKCQKCNSTICNFCQENYTLVNDNYKKCLPKADYQKGYYQNAKGNMYYPCIDNCDKCENSIECIECSLNYSLLGDRTSCGACMIAEVIFDDELSMKNMDKLVQTYINNYRKSYDVAMVYSNPSLNITLTVFRTWQCTELLLSEKYYRMNIAEFVEKLKKKLNKSGSSFVFSMINYNYKSYFEVYDVDLDRKIDIKNECPECLRVEYEIKNDFTSEITHFLGNKLSKMVNKYNINVLNSSDPHFHDVCKNVEIESIDLSIDERRSILYLGNDLKKITCLDDDCSLNSVFYDESTGNCKCKFNFDFEKLINNSTSINNGYTEFDPKENQEIFEPVSGINPLPVFKCSQEAFNNKNIFSNVALYIAIIALLIQIFSFTIVFIKYCTRKKIVKNIASPPPKDFLTLKKKVLTKDDTEKETQLKDKDYDSFFDGADFEKKVQDRDEDELDEEIENEDDFKESKYYKNNSKILSEENSFDSERKNAIFSSQRKMNEFNFEGKMNPDEAVNNFSRISEIKRKPTEELDYSNLSKKSSNESLDLSEDEIFTLVKDNKGKLELDYMVLSEAVKNDERSILELYTHLLALKQPIWDMLSDINALQINKSFVPLGMKIIRFVFMFCFNMFLNSLFLTQKYFKKKFNYFNDKYNIKYNENSSTISSTEKFTYALKNTIVFSISTFIICLFIQFVINYCFFNLRRKIWIILKECDDNKREEIKEMNKFFNKQNSIYIIIACVNFILIIFFFFYLINFSQAYKGGILDYVGATFMTWLFLQVIPFISCIISALFRYYGLKNQNNRLYKLNQIYIY